MIFGPAVVFSRCMCSSLDEFVSQAGWLLAASSVILLTSARRHCMDTLDGL